MGKLIISLLAFSAIGLSTTGCIREYVCGCTNNSDPTDIMPRRVGAKNKEEAIQKCNQLSDTTYHCVLN